MRTLFGAPASEEESRGYLQARLTVLWKIMFWAFVALISAQWVLYEYVYPSIKPVYQNAIYATACASLAVMAFIWRGVLLRRTLTVEQLFALDMVYACGIGIELALAALCAYNFPPSHYVCLIYAAYAVFTRAIIVPSSGRRTAIVSALTFVPVLISAFILAVWIDVRVPGPVFFLGALLLSGVGVLLAAIGSLRIYGLRRQVSAAMQLGQYTLDRKIGGGGMGTVYRAHHRLLRRPTAVKLLRADRVGRENLERFEREVQAMSQLTHPNTVAVFDYGHSADGVFYYAMEYLGGGIDLENLVRKHGPQPEGRVVAILVQVCGALQEAHERELVHRDIKPANIILCVRGGMPDVAKVVDFGLVEQITAATGASTQVILGTPAYVAPETLTDPTESSLRPAVDLYALGAVGYFLLTGRRVFEGKTTLETCVQHLTATPRRPSEMAPVRVSAGLEAIILKCLEKRPEDRFGSAVALADALNELPPSKDWDQAEARRWWRDFRAAEEASLAASSTPTLTITVDLGERDLSGT